jgi:preprotein translocase subunit SecG
MEKMIIFIIAIVFIVGAFILALFYRMNEDKKDL